MDGLGSNDNTLTRAIYKNDWAEVTRLCETEQTLINTYDKHGFTPLIYAVQEHNAPDDVVLRMIEQVTTELIENEDDAGYTILHILSVNAYTLSLRRALERSTKHVNKRDDDGRTPLHDCLDASCTYDQHRQTALCLMTYGGSATIKDDWGMTPLDLYDDNECSKYEESTRDEKKLELRELLQGKVPLEVLARGPDANSAFIEAMQEGSKRIYQTRLMLVGPERVGKTSLTKALTEQVFNNVEESTDGIDTSLSCTLSVKQTTNWKAKSVEGAVGGAREQYLRAVAEKIAAKLQQKKQGKHPDIQIIQSSVIDKIKNFQIREPDRGTSKMDKSDDSTKQPPDQQASSEESSKSDSALPVTPIQDVPEEVVKLVLQILQEKGEAIEVLEGSVEDLSLSIWDFAGQDLYYITHQLLVSEHHNNMTNLDFIIFWLRSIYSNTTENPSVSNQKQLSPSVFIVGSHRDSLPGDVQEKLAAAQKRFEMIQKKLKGTPYEGHVVSKYYAIDNSFRSPLDQSIIELRDHITEVARLEHYMGQEIPLKWLDFLQEIEQLCKERQSICFQEVKELAAKCGVVKEIQLFTMLHFYHDLGNIIYYGERATPDSALNDIIVLKPNWLICIFRRVFTVKSQTDQWGKFKSSWARLDEEGILEERLIRHMWHDFIDQLEGLLQLMQKFDLLCEKTVEAPTVAESSDEGDRLFYAPSLLKKQIDETVGLDQLNRSKSAAMLYIDFNGFLPEGLFYRLIVRLLQWSQQKGGYEPKLFYQQANLYLDEDHDMILRIMPQQRSIIQVAIMRARLVGSDDDDDDEDEVEPSPAICKIVLTLLQENLMYLGHTWMKRIDFEFCILCSICDKKKLIHFHQLKRCLKEKAVPCGMQRMKTARFRRFFAECNLTRCTEVVNATQVGPSPKTTVHPVTSRKVPPFLRSLSGVFNEISSPIMPFDLMTEICVLLDPLHPLSNDWRGLACKLGYDRYIHYLARKDSPTMCVMNGWSEKGWSVKDLKECMVSMNRHDVVRLIDKHLPSVR